MEELYRNPLLTIALSILALLMIGNSGIQLYMLNCPPILIEKDLTGTHVAYGFVGAAGYSLGPLIYLNPTTEPTRYRVLRHEYQHYMQSALLSPLLFSIAYSFDEFILGHDYHENWFEIDAQRAEKDLISFKVFDWNLKKLVEINPP
ncbi:MAG: hypothetical protein QM445_04270 [Thermotogota bacterium]|jgi:hypothetical protein|nr:hypothetical protein [Thermotogota bacterium]